MHYNNISLQKNVTIYKSGSCNGNMAVSESDSLASRNSRYSKRRQQHDS